MLKHVQKLLEWCDALEAWGFDIHAGLDDKGPVITVKRRRSALQRIFGDGHR